MKKTLKRTMSILLTVVFLLTMLSACTAKTEPAASKPASAEPTASDDKIKIGISTCIMTEFFVDQIAAYDAAASKNGNVEIVGKFDANMDSQKQIDHVTTFVSQGVDAIIISLVDTTIAEEIIKLANGIPIIFTNRPPVESTLVDGKYAYVGSTETDAGKFQGDYIGKMLVEKGLTEANYVMFIGDLGAENAKQRTESAKAALEAQGLKLVKVFEDAANWDRTEAMNKMQQVIGTGKKIDCVLANCDEMALGAIEALKAANMLKDIPVAGLDGVKNALVAVQNGEMSMTVLQNAQSQAEAAMSAAIKVSKGEKLEKYYWVPYEAITKENVKNYMK